MLNARFRRMNGKGSNGRLSRTTFAHNQMATITDWMTMNRQLPMKPVTRSATRAPSGAAFDTAVSPSADGRRAERGSATSGS